jgi:hypothetical protein
MSQNPFSNEFPIGRLSGRCAKCEQPLQPGQVYYAVIWEEDSEYVREDYDERCWSEPPAGALGVWRATVPVPQKHNKPRHVPPTLLMRVFERLGETDGEQATRLRFVLALLLLRRKLLRDGGLHEQNGVQIWRMRRPADDSEFEVVCPPLSAQDTEDLSQQLADLLAGLEAEAEALE